MPLSRHDGEYSVGPSPASSGGKGGQRVAAQFDGLANDVGKPRGIDQVYNHDEQWIIRNMAFEAAHDYIAELVGAKRVGKVVRLQRTNPLDPIKAELLGRLREHYAAETAWWSYR